MKTLNELKQMVKERLLEQYEVVYTWATGDESFGTKDKFHIEEKEVYNQFSNKYQINEELWGYTIDCRTTYRNNGTNENTSVYLSISRWRAQNGSTIRQVKIYNRFSDKKINKMIDEIFEEYNNLTVE